MPLHRHQRRNHRRLAHHLEEGRLLVRLLRKREQPRDEALRNQRPRSKPHGRGGIHEHPPPGAHREALRRNAQRMGQAPGLHPRRVLHPGHEQGALRRGPHGIRSPEVARDLPRNRRHHHVRRHRGHGRRHPPTGALLQARVLRSVHPVPGGNLLAGGRPDQDGEGRRRQARDPHARGDRPPDRGPDHLRPRRRRRLARPGSPPSLQGGHREAHRRPVEFRPRGRLPDLLVGGSIRERRLGGRVRRGPHLQQEQDGERLMIDGSGRSVGRHLAPARNKNYNYNSRY
mmetsp:Transcript_21631/g.51592  ORF Transcript_21631/g.51592 Transcript_21631/m.51592 type:complete len:286 (+) Transcript_21631:928-1785(+)